MKTESNFIKNVDIDLANERAKKLISEYAVKLESFIDLYGEEVVGRDKQYVEKMEGLFSKTEDINAKLATIFEAIFAYHAEMSNWLGENVMVMKTSRYDDIKNGVDMVAEFVEEDDVVQHMALAVDVTTSDELTKKFRRIREEINRGELASVKYFISENLGMRGELSMIPRVVIGASRKTIEDVREMWMNEDNKSLAESPIQFQILEEVLMQLEAFYKYAEKVGNNKTCSVFARYIKIIKK